MRCPKGRKTFVEKRVSGTDPRHHRRENRATGVKRLKGAEGADLTPSTPLLFVARRSLLGRSRRQRFHRSFVNRR